MRIVHLRHLAVLVAILLWTVPAMPAPPAPQGHPVLPGIWRLYGDDPFLAADDDLEPLRRIVGKAPVVALGESVHGSGGYYRLKHRVFRFLVEEMGFRAFAFESPWTDADRVAAYVQTCAGTPEEALRGLFGVWQSTETRDLIQWMCEWNRSHSKDKLHFFGFDIQQPEQDGPALLAYLERIGVTADDPWIAGVRACNGVGAPAIEPPGELPPEGYVQCLQALQEIDAHFRTNARTLQRRTSKKDLELAKLYVVGLRAWEDAVFYFPIDDPRSYSARDEGMAYAFQTLRTLRFPKAKVALWAHNSHIARRTLRHGERPMGSHLATALGSSYVNFALAGYQVARDRGAPSVCGPVTTPGAGSVELPLHELGEEALLVDLRFPGTSDPYLPPGTYSVGDRSLVPHDLYTGILFLERSPKMTPVNRPPACQ